MSPPTLAEPTLPADVARLLGDIPVRRPRRCTAASWGAASARGSARSTNEDRWDVRADRSFVVADGMGGRPGGGPAASCATRTLLDRADAPAADVSAVIDWHLVLNDVNDAVRQQAEDAGHRRSGAALAALFLRGSRVTVVHVGDVRVYRVRAAAGELVTTDHNVREELARAGLDATKMGFGAAELGALTAYLGDPHSVDGFSVRNLAVAAGDRLVVCSDGVHRFVQPTMQDLHRLNDADAAQWLVRHAVQLGSSDDATAIVCTLDLERPPT
jgi:PPM family protein phosphatase